MSPTQAAKILKQHNEWRRYGDNKHPQPDPKLVGIAIDVAVEFLTRPEAEKK